MVISRWHVEVGNGRVLFTGAWHAGLPHRRTPLSVRADTEAAATGGDVNWPRHYLWGTAVRN